MKRLPTRDRLHQIKRWFEDEWGYKVRLRVERKLPKAYAGCLGCCEVGTKKEIPLVRVRLTNRTESIATLIHELAHVIDFHRNGWDERRKFEGHDRKWAACHHEIETRFLYEGGESDSGFF